MDFVLEILGDSRELIRTSFAQNLLQLSLDCQVTLSKGELSLKNALPVSDIRQRLTELGIRVPNECRKDAYDIFRYLRKHGSSYLALHQAVDVRSGESTLDEGGVPLACRKEWRPEVSLLMDPDIYLNFHLREQLSRFYTDFDLFRVYSLGEYADQITSRSHIIELCMNRYFPAGEFELLPEDAITLKYKRVGRVQTYNTVEGLKCFARQIQTLKSQSGTPVGLYQLAHLLRGNAELHEYYLAQIRICEQKGTPKLRFTQRFREFNRSLDTSPSLSVHRRPE